MNPIQVRLRLNTLLAPILVIILVVVKFLDPFRGWTILLIGLGCAVLLSWLWARSLARHLRLYREIRFGWVQVGDRMEERFRLVNEGFFPALWVEVIDHTNMPGYRASCASAVGGYAENSWIIEGVCEKRGEYNHGPLTMRTSDPFNFFSVEIFDPRMSKFLVLPPIVPLPRIVITPSGWGGEGLPRANVPVQTVSASGVRPFLPGDTPRWIHWRTTARLSELFVRVFDGSPSGNWWIALDLDQATQVGTGLHSTIEYAVILAASLAVEGLHQGRAVGLSINAAQPIWIPSRHGEGQRWDILRNLAQVAPTTHTLDEFLPSLPVMINQQNSLIVITANPNPSWVKTLFPFIWSGYSPMVCLLDPQSFGGVQELTPIIKVMSQFGIPYQVVPKAYLDRPELRPGKIGQRQWRVTPLGRAVLVNPSGDQNWRRIT